jgi:hypothetical protein
VSLQKLIALFRRPKQHLLWFILFLLQNTSAALRENLKGLLARAQKRAVVGTFALI